MMMTAHCRGDSSPFLKPQVGKKDTIEGCGRSKEVDAWQGKRRCATAIPKHQLACSERRGFVLIYNTK